MKTIWNSDGIDEPVLICPPPTKHTGDNHCVVCMRDFNVTLPCCCDFATHEDGSHDDGICVECCGPHPSRFGNDQV